MKDVNDEERRNATAKSEDKEKDKQAQGLLYVVCFFGGEGETQK